MAVIECPYCTEILEVEPPDRSHTAFSVSKPIPSIYYGELVKKTVRCVKCKETFTVFWYAPLEYFARI